MSLFGRPAQTPAAGGGLFGSTTPAGQPPASQATGTGGLFGSTLLGGAQQQPTQGQTGSAVGGLGGTTQAQPSTSSAFGGLGGGLGGFGTSTATTRPSLFGDTKAAVPSTGGAFGGSLGLGLGSTTTTTAGQASTFGGATSTLGLGQSQMPAQQTTQAQPTGAYFDSLLAKSRKQADGEGALGALPSLNLGLGDLRERLRKIGPKERAPLSGRAHYVLAASGVDPGAAVKDLGAFGASSKHEGRGERASQGLAPGEVDLETYLANIQNRTTMSMIAEGLEQSQRDFDRFLEDNVTMEWEAQRRRIYQHFGIKPRDDTVGGPESAGGAGEGSQGGFGRSRRTRSHAGTPKATEKTSVLGRSVFGRSVIGTPSRIGTHAPEFSDVDGVTEKGAANGNGVASMDDRFLRDKQGKLSDTIRTLNDVRQSGDKMFILHELADVASKSGDPHAPHIVDAYNAVADVVDEIPEEDKVPRQRQFAAAYLDPNPNSQNAVNMRKRILAGANRFLEQQFMEEITSAIQKHQQEASQGGRPDVVSKIKAFIRLRVAHKGLVPDKHADQLQEVGGEYVWAVVYYLLRSGHVTEAAKYVNDNTNHFRSIDRAFSGYLNSYASSEERRLKRAMQERINNEYHQRTHIAAENSIDPFRMACYKIVGRCEVNNRSLDGLITDVNDWIWLQFNLAREGDRASELASETYGLAELQTSIKEIGAKHFPKSPAEDTDGKFAMFFYLQILAGMYEQAIAYLYPFSYVDAVHFAVGLSYYGLLRASDPASADNVLLSYSTRQQPQINFGRMLGYYTRDFRSANVVAAVDYLALICLNADDVKSPADRAQAALCHEALRELVLETREFSKLIGDIRPDGRRIKGYIEQRGSLIALKEEDDFVRAITLQAANFADDNGRTTDAVLLYHLAGDYDTVIGIVSRALSEAISIDIGDEPARLEPVKPRAQNGSVAGQSQQRQQDQGSSLSLAAIDDPVELARTMMNMYEHDNMFKSKIREQNRIAIDVLLRMSEIKVLVEQEEWMKCFDKIRDLDILPLNAKGDPSLIRSYASKFSALPQPVAINVPNLLMWTLICCTRYRERLLSGQFTANEYVSRQMADDLKVVAADLTTYTSQLRYRFPPSLLEALARAGAE